MSVMGVTKFERFFRSTAGADVDNQDLKRYSEFANRKIRDLLVRGEAIAKANDRDIIQPHDLAITKGLQECIQAFAIFDGEIELKAILEHITSRPPLDLTMSVETESSLAAIAGGLSVALARGFRITDPTMKNPSADDWERALQIFNLLL
jgi:hypothetical protein